MLADASKGMEPITTRGRGIRGEEKREEGGEARRMKTERNEGIWGY